MCVVCCSLSLFLDPSLLLIDVDCRVVSVVCSLPLYAVGCVLVVCCCVLPLVVC